MITEKLGEYPTKDIIVTLYNLIDELDLKGNITIADHDPDDEYCHADISISTDLPAEQVNRLLAWWKDYKAEGTMYR